MAAFKQGRGRAIPDLQYKRIVQYRRRALLVGMFFCAALLPMTPRPSDAAYDWLFEQEAGELTIVAEQYQSSTADYDKYSVVIRPAGADVEDIPAILCLPRNAQPPYPVAVLIHGHGGNKAGPVSLISAPLAQNGIASIAYDLPDHGERNTENGTFFDDWNDWERITAGVALSVTDGRWVVDYLQTRPDIDTARIGAMGYSLGAYTGCILTDVEDQITGLVMNVGGTNLAAEQYIKDTYGMLVWNLYAGGFFPTTHAPDITPRPAWMLNGLQDTTITPPNTQALYDALQQPKKITWYDAGHSLPRPESTNEAVGYLYNLFTTPNDLDGDGLTNDEEISTQGTLPLEEDTDGDGLTDGFEVNTSGSDPLNTDTDDDGIPDGDEVNVYGTNPSNSDSDNDEYRDLIEISCGSNPLDQDSKPSAIKVNFQPIDGSAPAGYVPDGGVGYATPKGYGWTL